MTGPPETRRPRAFNLDDPAVVAPLPRPEPVEPEPPRPPTAEDTEGAGPEVQSSGAGFGWGGLLLSAVFALITLAAGLWFTRFASEALARNDALGWIAWGLAIVIAVCLAAIVLRELIGLMRLSRLGTLRRDAERALAERDTRVERRCVERLSAAMAAAPARRWGRARVAEHMGDVRDPGDFLKLAERELLTPLDAEARRLVLTSAKRVAMVTAISPIAVLGMLFVLVENLRLLRGIAALYGGRPGLLGGLKLARMVFTHIIASGGIALTDDILGQLFGQDMLRRLSRRLGEGAVNGALTARIGVAAVEVVRPLPYLDAPPVRLRDMVGELFRRRSGEVQARS
jgi:putative membrane protein